MKRVRLNIVLIVVDTLRAGSLGVYGQKPSPSPVLDRLSREGVVFENAYTTITRTDPAISAILSGKYPWSLGVVNHGIDLRKSEVRSLTETLYLQEVLRKNGYQTIAVDWLGRWFRKGFDQYSGEVMVKKSQAFGVKATFLYRYGRILDLALIRLLGRDFFFRTFYRFFPEKIPYDPASVVVKKAIDCLSQDQKKPFFLYLHFWDPHFPYTQEGTLASWLKDSLLERYLKEIKFVDRQIDRLFAFLQKTKLAKKTLVVLTSDHGENLTEHGIFISHRGLYETTVKVPLLFHGSFLGPAKVGALVQHVDIVPTILALAGIKVPAGLDGQNLLPLLKGRKKAVREAVFFEEAIPGELGIRRAKRLRGLRWGPFKFIQTFIGKERYIFKSQMKSKKLQLLEEELFDLKKDLGEQKNIVGEKKKLLFGLRRRLAQGFARKKGKKILSSRVVGKQGQSAKKELAARLRALGYW